MNPSDEKPPTPFAVKLGLGLWVISLIWWFAYYAQYGGAFRLLDLKLACVSNATRECLFFQQNIRGLIPVYWPIFWWAGVAALTVGVYQTWQQRKK